MDSPKYVVTYYTGHRDLYGQDIYCHGEGKTITKAIRAMEDNEFMMVEKLQKQIEEMQSISDKFKERQNVLH